MIEFDYVVSAPGRFGSFDQMTSENPNVAMVIKAYIQLCDMTRPKDSGFSLLYNAYTEGELKDRLEIYNYYGAKAPRYLDSGGLQIITTGAKIDDAMKKKIWTTQAEANCYAMCFDEMPLHIDGESSRRGDVSNRILLQEKISVAGDITGQGVQQQIELFKQLQSQSKVMLIGQGQSVETFSTYLNHAITNIAEENYPFIQGLSLSQACFSTRKFASIDMFNIIRNLQVPESFKQHIHLLGAGTIRKIIPAIMLYRSGFLDKFKLSYDSTTHAASFDMGQFTYYEDFKLEMMNLGKVRNETVERVYFNKIYDPNKTLFEKIGIKSFDEFMEYSIYTTNPALKDAKPKQYKAFSPTHAIMFPLIKFIYIHSQIMDFNKMVSDLVEGRTIVENLVKQEEMAKVYNMLLDVKDNKDFETFTNFVKRHYIQVQPNIRKYDNFDDFYASEKVFGDLF